jgi:hypothetical protein
MPGARRLGVQMHCLLPIQYKLVHHSFITPAATTTWKLTYRHIQLHTLTYLHTAHTNTHLHIHTHIHTHAHTYTHTRTHTANSPSTAAPYHGNTHNNMHAHTHIHTRTHTQAHTHCKQPLTCSTVSRTMDEAASLRARSSAPA